MPLKKCEDIEKELRDCIISDNALLLISKEFFEFKTDYERVAKAYSLLRNYNLLPNITLKRNKKKSSSVSEKYRNYGNKAFVQKDDMSALYYYTRAIGFGITGSKEIALAFANRSAVTYSLGEFSDAIKDISQALQGDYPDHLKFKLWQRKGNSLLELESFSEAQEAFENSIKWLMNSELDEEKRDAAREQLTSLLKKCSKEHCKESNVALQKNTEIPQLKHGPNPSLQSGSSALEVNYSPEMGRHLIATVDINPGDVLAVEKPFASIPLPNTYFFFCFYCHKRCHSLQPCINCTLVFFCDEKCRKNCWEESHSIECNILPSLFSLNCEKIELLSLRVLIKATKKGKNLSQLASTLYDIESFDKPIRKGFTNGVYLSDSYKSIHNLEGNTNYRSPSYMFGRSVYAACMLHTLDTITNFFKTCSAVKTPKLKHLVELENDYQIRWDKIFAGGLILKYLQSMASNGHEISEMRVLPSSEIKTESSEIGSAAYALLSLINHSCDPNVVRHSYCGSTVVLAAIQTIKKGDQIFDNYGLHHATHTKDQRHSRLKYQYFFKCQCLACSEDWPLYYNLPERNPILLPGADVKIMEKSSVEFSNIVLKLIYEYDKDKLEEWLKFLYSHLILLEKSVVRPWKEHSECQEAIKQCLSLLGNHYVFKSCPSSLMAMRDEDVGMPPF